MKTLTPRAMSKLNRLIAELQDWADRYDVNIQNAVDELHETRVDLEEADSATEATA